MSWFKLILDKQLDAMKAYIVNSLIGGRLISRAVRPYLLRLVGARIGKTWVEASCEFISIGNVSIGDHGYINRGCIFDAAAPIDIGSGVALGPRVSLLTATHLMGPTQRRAGEHHNLPIRIHDGVWIGAGATVLPGVTIGPGAVIAAGSVVTRDCAGDQLHAGVPARSVRELDPQGSNPSLSQE